MSSQNKKVDINGKENNVQQQINNATIGEQKQNEHVSNSSGDLSGKSDSFSTISNLLDNLNKNSLNLFYQNSTSTFKKKIDELNLKFYLETEKYLSNKKKDFNCQNALFIILFKQISLYIEEIERLNLLIQERKFEPKNIKERTDEIIKKSKEFETKELLIKTLKDSKAHVESKLLEVICNEDKLRMENEKLKKENEYLKEQLKSLLPNSKPLTAQIELFHHNSKILSTNANNTVRSTEKTPTVPKQRNNSDSNPGVHKKNNNSETTMMKAKQKREVGGLIKAVKEKLIRRTSSNEYKIKSSGNIASSPRYCHSPTISPGHDTKQKSNNTEFVDRFLNDLKLDSNETLPKSSKEIGHVKTEVIISDLEEYCNNNSNKINLMIENSLTNSHVQNKKGTVINSNVHSKKKFVGHQAKNKKNNQIKI